MLNTGDTAPDFMLADQAGTERSLSSLVHEGSCVLYFYPADFSPVCTAQTCAFRDTFAGSCGHERADRRNQPPERGQSSSFRRTVRCVLSVAGGSSQTGHSGLRCGRAVRFWGSPCDLPGRSWAGDSKPGGVGSAARIAQRAGAQRDRSRKLTRDGLPLRSGDSRWLRCQTATMLPICFRYA